MNFTLALDNKLAGHFMNLEPHKSCFELEKPRTISGNLSIPKTVVATISNWMHSETIGDTQMEPGFLEQVCQ